MNLISFTKEAYKSLKKDLDNNRDNYYSEDPWLEGYFKEAGIAKYTRTSSVVVPNIDLMYSGEDDKTKNQDDLSNIRQIYGAYKDKITPLQASDPMLWSALCHIVYRDYVLKRWKKDDGTVSIGQRFFATESRASLCYYNAVARLWWSGYLTYDEERETSNPYHLTETLLSAQQIQKDLFDQSLSMNKTIVRGLLTALKRIQEKTGNASTNVFRQCCDSYLNRYGAVVVLDALSAEEIEEIAFRFMKKNIKFRYK